MRVHTHLRYLALAAIAWVPLATLSVHGEDWRQFRGNDATGVAVDGNLARRIDEQTMQWKAELPGGGISGPIVVGDRVYVTASSGFLQDRLHVLCFSAKTGQLTWERQFWATGSTTCHDTMRVATATPASDGQRIFAVYSSNDVVCLDLDGQLVWCRALGLEAPNTSNSLGMASSPVVLGDTVILQTEADADALVWGINATTGETRWKLVRNRASNWTSPSILRGPSSDQDRVVLQSSSGIDVLNPASGEVVWSYDQGADTIASSTVSQGVVYAVSQGLTALQPPANESDVDVLWSEQKLAPGSPSPIVDGERVYVVSGKILTTGDASNGEVIWRMRLTGSSRYWSTPLLGNGHLYLFDQDGVARVVELGEKKGTIVSEYELGGDVLCTPAASNDAIFVRSHSHLWKFSE